MKISDFGLARETVDDIYSLSTDEMMPIKWMAIECLEKREYTQATDVWAFGVLLWEIFSFGATVSRFAGFRKNCGAAHQRLQSSAVLRPPRLGLLLFQQPYPDIGNPQVLPHLQSGRRLESPSGCPSTMYQIMLKCWAARPKERPDFEYLRSELIALSGRQESYYEDSDAQAALTMQRSVGSRQTTLSVYEQPTPLGAGAEYGDALTRADLPGVYDNTISIPEAAHEDGEEEESAAGAQPPGSVVYDMGAAEGPAKTVAMSSSRAKNGSKNAVRLKEGPSAGSDDDDHDGPGGSLPLYDMGNADASPSAGDGKDKGKASGGTSKGMAVNSSFNAKRKSSQLGKPPTVGDYLQVDEEGSVQEFKGF